VYRLFGSKGGILAAVLDVAFVGDDEPVAMGDRPAVRAGLGESDPGRLLASFARICRELLDRSAPLQHVLRCAAVVDPEAARLLTKVNRERLAGQGRVARALADRNALAEGITEAEAADTIYTSMAPEVHRTLTVERCWSAERYERWLAHALRSMLLSPPHG
jgi:hypothetical protein